MISYVVLFSDAAEGDLAQLLTYLVPQAGERVALAYVDKLIDYCTEFATFPERGLRRDARPTDRRLSPQSHHRLSRQRRHRNDPPHLSRRQGYRCHIHWRSLIDRNHSNSIGGPRAPFSSEAANRLCHVQYPIDLHSGATDPAGYVGRA
ncbi:type II toxin-antitoxin system RelE/ParE family toxin [Shinella sp.]|uniref:type II toxin-antitoxin system RelE/ParE family toxin n=1 Tax=Shinella sp. TaxID=1870904 RepID=UPI0039180DA1